MNWIQKKLQSFVEKAKNTFKRQRPSKDDQEKSLWINCPGCKNMQLKEDLLKDFNICKCNFHFDLDPKIKFEKLYLTTKNGNIFTVQVGVIQIL